MESTLVQIPFSLIHGMVNGIDVPKLNRFGYGAINPLVRAVLLGLMKEARNAQNAYVAYGGLALLPI